MIKARLHLDKYNWVVDCYLAVDAYYVTEIVRDLRSIGCSEDVQYDAYRNMASMNLDTGLCYSNIERHRSILVTSITSKASEFFNSVTHEIGHLACHIGQAYDTDPYGEENQYIAGDIAKALYPYCRSLLCEHCRASHDS